MAAVPFTIVDEQRAHDVWANHEDGRVRLPPESLEAALGFRLEPQGFCRGSVCIPARGRPGLVSERGVDLAAFAELVGRPLAIDAAEGVAALAVSAEERAQHLASLEAPDFELPDLAGRRHRLSEHRGKKVLLIAYASW
jgi:hypothetical protein